MVEQNRNTKIKISSFKQSSIGVLREKLPREGFTDFKNIKVMAILINCILLFHFKIYRKQKQIQLRSG